MTAKRYAGFLTWDQSASDPDVIYRADLTSLPSGASLVGASQSQINFTAGGVQFATADSAHKNGIYLGASWASAANLAKLKNGGHLSFDIESSAFNIQTLTANMNYFFRASKSAGGVVSLTKFSSNSDTNNYVIFDDPPSGASAGYARTRIAPYGKGSTVNIKYGFGNFGVDLYADYFRVAHKPYFTNTPGLIDFDDFYLGGDGVTYGGIPVARMSNFYVSTRPIMIPVNQKLRNVGMLGHSFAGFGGYVGDTTARFANYLSLANDTRMQSTGYAMGLEGGTADCGISPSIHRKVMRRGFNIGRQIYNACAPGLATSELNTALSGGVARMVGNVHSMDFMFIIHGINDIDSSGNITATLLADYKTAIDSIVAAYPSITKIIITNVCSPKNLTAYDNASVVAAVNTVNSTIYPALAAYNSKVVIADIFTLMGGHTITAVEWPTPGSSLHPSDTGYAKIGNYLGDILLSYV